MGQKNRILARKHTKSKIQGMQAASEKNSEVAIGSCIEFKRVFPHGLPEKETEEAFLQRGGKIKKGRYAAKNTKKKRSRYGDWELDVPQSHSTPREPVKVIKRKRG